MKLIDADALIAWIKESQQMTSKVRAIICKIESMPDAVEVVHGEWKPLRGRYAECSVCEESYYMPHLRWSNFCPCCGAKMRGADDE